jgi:hypothetical protein
VLSRGLESLVFVPVMIVGSVPLVMVQVFGMVSLVVLSLLDVLHLVLNTRLGGVIALTLRGAIYHGLPFMVLVLLQRDSGFPVVVLALVGMTGWSVLTPLWSRWLNTGFTLLVLTLVLSRLLTHVLIF